MEDRIGGLGGREWPGCLNLVSSCHMGLMHALTPSDWRSHQSFETQGLLLTSCDCLARLNWRNAAYGEVVAGIW